MFGDLTRSMALALALLVGLALGVACGTDLLDKECTVQTQATDCFEGWACDLASGAVCRRTCDSTPCPVAYECDANRFCQKDAGTDGDSN